MSNIKESGKQLGFKSDGTGGIELFTEEVTFPLKGEWRQANLFDWGKLQEIKKEGK
mgnify:CR=1 FL=1